MDKVEVIIKGYLKWALYVKVNLQDWLTKTAKILKPKPTDNRYYLTDKLKPFLQEEKMSQDGRWHNITDACQLLDISERTLYRWIDEGKVESRKDGNRRLVKVEKTGLDKSSDIRQAYNRLLSENEWLRGRVEDLEAELSDVRKRSDTIILKLTGELDKKTKALEDLRNKPPFWKFWRRKESSEDS